MESSKQTAASERLSAVEKRQTEIIKMIAGMRGFEFGHKLDLKNVRYDQNAKTLSGTLRERRIISDAWVRRMDFHERITQHVAGHDINHLIQIKAIRDSLQNKRL